MGQERTRLAALTLGHVEVMLAGVLAGGCSNMSRRASETWKHLSSASLASLLGCWRWALVSLAVCWIMLTGTFCGVALVDTCSAYSHLCVGRGWHSWP